MRSSPLVVLSCVIVGCSTSPTLPKNASNEVIPKETFPSEPKPKPKAKTSTDDTTETKTLELPTECADGSSDPCVMPESYVKRLCAEAYPELALYLFAKDSPWTRIYVSARKVEPFNGHGGPSSDKDLEFDEELLVLSTRDPNLGGMSVSGVEKSYDVLRWDGTCATLQAGEVRLHQPPQPKHAVVEWRHLDIEVRNALREDDKIKALAEKRRRECKGVTMGVVSAQCEKADTALKSRVVQVIRDGFQIPKPTTLP